MVAYVVIAEGYLKQCHPGRVIGTVEGWFHSRESFVQKVERLTEAEQYHHVYYTEGQHVSRYHAVHHGDEWTGQPDSPVKNNNRDMGEMMMIMIKRFVADNEALKRVQTIR